jgi:hypothetical protein
MDTYCETSSENQISSAYLVLSRDAFTDVSSNTQETPEHKHEQVRLSKLFVMMAAMSIILFQIMRRSRYSMTQRDNQCIRLMVNLVRCVYKLSMSVLAITFAVTRSSLSTALYIIQLVCFVVMTLFQCLQVISVFVRSIVYSILQFVCSCFRTKKHRYDYMLFPKTDGYSDQYGTCSSKVPPSWDPSWDKQYPFHVYQQDVLLWANGICELDDHQRGPAVAMRLQGVAREVVRELNLQVLMHGHMIPDPNVPPNVAQGIQIPQVFQSGLEYLFVILRTRFGMLPQETAIQGISDFLMFSRHHGENTDQTISRFEILRHRAFNQAGLVVSETGCAWMLLMVLHIPLDKWPILLSPFEGALPNNRAQYSQFLLYLRRNGHLYDKSSHSIKQPYFMHGHEAQSDSQPFWQGYPIVSGSGAQDSNDRDETYTMSSGQSDDDEDIDWTDTQGMTNDEVGEKLYVQYRRAKRRWRSFSSGGPKRHFRRFRRKGKGKGKFRKGKGKGFGFRGSGKGGKAKPGSEGSGAGKGLKTFFEDPGEEIDYDEDDWSELEPMYPTAKVKTNPLGPDGKPLKCLVCGSIDHFRNKCPKRDQKPQYFEHTDASSSSTSNTREQRTVWFNTHAYTAHSDAQSVNSDSNSILLDDGSFIIIRGHQSTVSDPSSYPDVTQLAEYSDPFVAQSSHEQPRHFMNFVQWLHEVKSTIARSITNIYHAEVRLPGTEREGILVDTGAIDNISGVNFVRRVEALAKRYRGKVTVTPLKETIGVSGVGKQADECTHEAVLPICLPDGRGGTFVTPVISNEQIPAIWGLKSMTEQRVVIDTRNKIMICMGLHGYKLEASPGSVTYKLEQSKTGHLFLPITEWKKQNKSAQSVAL